MVAKIPWLQCIYFWTTYAQGRRLCGIEPKTYMRTVNLNFWNLKRESETLIITATTPESEYANLSLQTSIKASVCDEEVSFRLWAVVNFCKFFICTI